MSLGLSQPGHRHVGPIHVANYGGHVRAGKEERVSAPAPELDVSKRLLFGSDRREGLALWTDSMRSPERIAGQPHGAFLFDRDAIGDTRLDGRYFGDRAPRNHPHSAAEPWILVSGMRNCFRYFDHTMG